MTSLQPNVQALYVLSAGDDPVAWGYAKDFAPVELARALARPAVVVSVGASVLVAESNPGRVSGRTQRRVATATLIVRVRNGADLCLHDRQLDPSGRQPGTFRVLTFAEVCQRALEHEIVAIGAQFRTGT